MNFRELIEQITTAACTGDAGTIVASFTSDGWYDDSFYGRFQGADIGTMITDYWHRDATAFRWDVKEVVADDRVGFARYVFSYESKLPGAEGQRAMFEGVSICDLEDGLVSLYREVADVTTGLVGSGFDDARLGGYVRRHAREVAARPESAGHT